MYNKNEYFYYHANYHSIKFMADLLSLLDYDTIYNIGYQLHYKKAQKYIEDGFKDVEEGYTHYLPDIIKSNTDITSKSVMVGILFMVEEAGHHIYKKRFLTFEGGISLREVIQKLSCIKTEEERLNLQDLSLYATIPVPKNSTYEEHYSPPKILKWLTNTIKNVIKILSEIQSQLLSMNFGNGMECFTPILQYIFEQYIPILINFGKKLISMNVDIYALVEEGPNIELWIPKLL